MVLTFQTGEIRHGAATAPRSHLCRVSSRPGTALENLLSLRSPEPVGRVGSDFEEHQVC